MLAFYKEWQESGLGKKAYCTQKGLTTSTFFYWIKKLALQNQSFSSAITGFTEVALAPQMDLAARPAAGKLVLEIEYICGTRLKLYWQVETSWIKSLL